MSKQKILFFLIDALCDIDVELMKTLPNFGWILERGALVKQVAPVYPSFTYPCHVSIMTGHYPNKHGIPHNEMVKAGEKDVPWYRYRHMVNSKFFTDYAKEHGYSTCAVNWPLTGGADIDFNMPMIVPFNYQGDDRLQFYEGYATQSLLDRYFWKYNWLQPSLKLSLDLYTMMVALDIIRDERQPDVMFVKLCDLDSVRHDLGVDNEAAKAQLRFHDQQIGALIESVRRYGDAENTHFIVAGDHGQTDVDKVIHLNTLLAERGFLTVDGAGELVDYDAYCHSTGMSGWIELKHPGDSATREKVYGFLKSIQADPHYGIDYVFTREEADAQYHLSGPFDFVIESKSGISFGNELTGPLFVDSAPGDYKTAMGSHGGLPERDHMTTFFACGPSIRSGAVLERARLVDEAPTMARILGFDMPDVDGRVLTEILK